jgi:hypothetical protein
LLARADTDHLAVVADNGYLTEDPKQHIATVSECGLRSHGERLEIGWVRRCRTRRCASGFPSPGDVKVVGFSRLDTAARTAAVVSLPTATGAPFRCRV